MLLEKVFVSSVAVLVLPTSGMHTTWHCFCVGQVLSFASCQVALTTTDVWTGAWTEVEDQNDDLYPLNFATFAQ